MPEKAPPVLGEVVAPLRPNGMDVVEKILRRSHYDLINILNDDEYSSSGDGVNMEEIEKEKKYHES